MSGSGINPLAILAPDLYVKQLAIQRRQALGQSLLQQGEGDPGRGAYGGLRSAGNTILGAFLAKRGDQDMANLYSPQSDASQIGPTPTPSGNAVQPLSESSAPEPQISNNPGSGPTPQALGAALQGNQAPQASSPQQTAPTPSAPRGIASVLSQAVKPLPGMSQRDSLMEYLNNPQAYYTALNSSNALTDLQKNTGAAYGSGTPEAAQVIQGTLQKGAINNIRPGQISQNLATGQMIGAPNAQGITPTQLPNGQIGMQLAPGALSSMAQASQAQNAGKQAVTPFTGYGPDGLPVATNNLAMTGNPTAQGLVQPQGPSLGGRSNNPLNMQPGGQESRYGSPMAGYVAASDNLANYAKQGVNTVEGIVGKWTGNSAPPEYAASVAKSLGVDPRQPINLNDPNVRGALISAMQPNETGHDFAPQGGGLMPALPASQGPYMASQGKDAADRHDTTVSLAAESPMRINVLDNIIKLSQSGVATGPGADFQNSLKGYIANTPGLGKLLGSTQANVGNFQELQKFMYQNALRNWQAAGGTGTDSQLESAAKANPNDHLFPQALQTIAKWGKASELAVQGKANAQDAFLGQNGQTPQNQLKFENTWRNAFDPKVFQYTLKSPVEKQAFAQQDLKTPQAAKAFIAKQQALKSLGALQ